MRVNGQPQGGTKIVPVYSQEFTDSLEQPKPIDDADLVKAIDITFKRLGAYPGKADAPRRRRCRTTTSTVLSGCR